MVRQARTPRGDGFAPWMRLVLLVVAVVGLMLFQDRLGLAGAGCFSSLAGSSSTGAPTTTARPAGATTP